MARRVLGTASKTDPRLSELVRHCAGEGFATYTGLFEGMPAFIADCGTLADLLDEDSTEDSVTVTVFVSDAERTAWVPAQLTVDD